ncbi:probable inactive receptor kinase At2g26730 [Tripterygium wilfordii]|uniref:probable inactive receptor kinase At2g26730 n=1 Tax=Tripterygium wilfordii TaxID=458696 RepID=UPI0018F80203|nr:probable inactive receptor kinase At2g26730 [Tripterygium wilfordii]
MSRIPIWVLFVLMLVLFPLPADAEDEQVKAALVQFIEKLWGGNAQRNQSWGWNVGSDPCNDQWLGVTCDSRSKTVRKIVLNKLNLAGTLDAGSLCVAASVSHLSLEGNNIYGSLPGEIGNCTNLTHLYLSGNRFTGSLPESMSRLSNLKRIYVSNNGFSGQLPNLSRISGLLSFIAENNELSGAIPSFDFSNLQEFNVSNNNFSGPIPDVQGKFSADSFLGNVGLCGELLSNACPPSSPTPPAPAPAPKEKLKESSTDRTLMYSGYAILGLVVVVFVAFKVGSKMRSKEEKLGEKKKGRAVSTSSDKPSGISSDYKTGTTRSEYSITSAESGMASSMLVLLTSPVAKRLRFEDLLRAPAELLGRGKHGSLYKVILDDGTIVVVKRIKDWSISKDNFKKRMQRLDQVKHPKVLPAVAFYCSNQEKLLVYEYQQNGSLFNLLHGSRHGRPFDWGSRLNAAGSIAEALQFMHEELWEDGIAHGNLKSLNILFNNAMEPQISEYGLMLVDNEDRSLLSKTNLAGYVQKQNSFNVDIHSFGLILLELLTGKLVHSNGIDLTNWVQSVVREEWTVEVFDRVLVSEGASEERMVNMLQVALKCINPSPSDRPTINQVVKMLNAIKDEEERSISSDA